MKKIIITLECDDTGLLMDIVRATAERVFTHYEGPTSMDVTWSTRHD